MGCPKIVPKGNLSEMVSNWQISIGYEDNQIMTDTSRRAIIELGNIHARVLYI